MPLIKKLHNRNREGKENTRGSENERNKGKGLSRMEREIERERDNNNLNERPHPNFVLSFFSSFLPLYPHLDLIT